MDTYTVFNDCTGETIYELDVSVRDHLGRITRKLETSEVSSNFEIDEVYLYDQAGRLYQIQRGANPAPENTYIYDDNGNRLQEIHPTANITAEYDNQDRLNTYGDNSYDYTDNGELASKETPQGTTTYGYDVLGALRSVVLPTGTSIDYIIDGFGRRVGKIKNGSFEKGFLYRDGLNPIAEIDASGNLRSVFIYATRSNVPDLMVNFDGGLRRIYRIISDHLGSVRLVVEADTGDIVQRMDYTAFGEVKNDTNPGFQPFAFAGGLYDPDTGLVRFGARDYDPEVGRWTSKDPILFEGGDTNLYGYVLNDPVNLNDTSGTSIFSGRYFISPAGWRAGQIGRNNFIGEGLLFALRASLIILHVDFVILAPIAAIIEGFYYYKFTHESKGPGNDDYAHCYLTCVGAKISITGSILLGLAKEVADECGGEGWEASDVEHDIFGSYNGGLWRNCHAVCKSRYGSRF